MSGTVWQSSVRTGEPCQPESAEVGSRTSYRPKHGFGFGPSSGQGKSHSEPHIDHVDVFATFLQGRLVELDCWSILAETEMSIGGGKRGRPGSGSERLRTSASQPCASLGRAIG
jgi:hypothetical protein